MADAAYEILRQDKKETGNFYIDDEILRKKGVTDFTKYKLDPNVKDEDLMPDFFIWLLCIFIQILTLKINKKKL